MNQSNIQLFDTSTIPADSFVNVKRRLTCTVDPIEQVINPALIPYTTMWEMNLAPGQVIVNLQYAEDDELNPWLTTIDYLNLFYCPTESHSARCTYTVRNDITYSMVYVENIDDTCEWYIQGSYGETITINGFTVNNLQRVHSGDYLCCDATGVFHVVSMAEGLAVFVPV